MDDRPIGIFDSGLGGLTVLRALADLLPGEDLVYVGDRARFPYGDRPLAEVARFARQLTGWLVGVAQVKAVVVACNTASAAALDQLRYLVNVPVVGMVEPGVRAAVRSRARRVGLLATAGTVASGAYERAFGTLAPGAELTSLACPGFVELVEAGSTTTAEAREVVAARLAAWRESGDRPTCVLLGCTHYPLLADAIRAALGEDTVLLSSAEETAFEVRRLLDLGGLWRREGRGVGRRRILSTSDPADFAAAAARVLAEPIGPVAFLPVDEIVEAELPWCEEREMPDRAIPSGA